MNFIKRLFKREYKYSISYNFKTLHGDGIGECTLCIDNKINTSEAIRSVKKSISSECLNDANAKIVILNILKLK